MTRRVGIDRAPVDVTTDEGARLLECFVWAGQDERLERLARAIEVVRANPPLLVRGDLADELPSVLEDRPTLVFQTAVFPYLVRRDARCRACARSSARPRAARVRHRRQAARPTSTAGACGSSCTRAREREFVGHADFHGAWLDYSF